jgi:hypothetical protein
MRWAGHLARMRRDEKYVQNFAWKTCRKETTCNSWRGWKDTVTLKWILEKQGLGCRLDSSGSGQGSVAGFCEHGNEPSGSTKCGEFLD